LAAWLARMLARPDIASHLEDYKSHKERHEMHDVWDAPLWWQFGEGFMSKEDQGVLKLLFGLSIDGFNPFHNKEAKQVNTLILRAKLHS
jgi:hypothetical protein